MHESVRMCQILAGFSLVSGCPEPLAVVHWRPGRDPTRWRGRWRGCCLLTLSVSGSPSSGSATGSPYSHPAIIQCFQTKANRHLQSWSRTGLQKRPGLCFDRCRTKRVRIKFIFCLLVGVSKVLTGPGYLGPLPTLDIFILAERDSNCTWIVFWNIDHVGIPTLGSFLWKGVLEGGLHFIKMWRKKETCLQGTSILQAYKRVIQITTIILTQGVGIPCLFWHGNP